MERQEGSEPITRSSANVSGRQARIDFLILADRADVANGKLFLMGESQPRLTALQSAVYVPQQTGAHSVEESKPTLSGSVTVSAP
jgi:hypothetical protein